jgi:hypothetical protein
MNSGTSLVAISCPQLKLIPVGKSAAAVPLSKPVSVLKPKAATSEASKPVESHVLFVNAGGHIRVRDLTRRSNLQLNGAAVVESELKNGDRLRFGAAEFEVSAPDFISANGALPHGSVAAVSPRGSNKRFKLPVPIAVFGRGDAVDVPVAGAGEGEVIAIIVALGGGFWLWDMNSPVATSMIDGKAVTRAELPSRCVLKFGASEFEFRTLVPRAASRVGATGTARPTAEQPPETSASIPPPIPVPDEPAARSTSEAATRKPVSVAGLDRTTSATPLTGEAGITRSTADIKSWGPLAFAVASAHEQSPIGSSGDPAEITGAQPPNKGRTILWISLAAMVVVLIAAASVGWFLGLWRF